MATRSIPGSGVAAVLGVALWSGPVSCGAPAPSPSDALSHDVERRRTLSYRMDDRARVTVDGGPGGSFSMSLRVSALMEMEAEPAGGVLRLTTRIPELSGEMTNPMAGTTTVTEAAIEGPLVFELDRRGGVAVLERPTLEGEAAQFVSPDGLARELFPRFPSGDPGPEGVWSDSLTYQAGSEEARTTATVQRTYAVEGDTLLDGRRLLRIGFRGSTRYVFRGTRMGLDVRQRMEGPIRGTVLWDPEERLMVFSRSRKELAGTMDVPAVGAPAMGLRLQGTITVRLR